MAACESSDLLGCGIGTRPTSTWTRTATARRSDQGSETAEVMPERRASEQLWRDEYGDEGATGGAPASEDAHVEISVGPTVVCNKRLSMPPEFSSTLPGGSPTKRSSHKPQFKIVLPPTNTIPGLHTESFFDRSLPLNAFPVLTPPEEIPRPSWGFHSNNHHEGNNIELTPPLDMEPRSSGCISSAPSAAKAAVTSSGNSTQYAGDVLTNSINLAVEKVVRATSPQTIRAVHQLVPSPISEESAAKPVSILKLILDQLQRRESEDSNWVLVTHAIPEKYPIKNITGSPPTTPQFLSGQGDGQDYFSVQRVIHNAIVLNDRHDLTSSHTLLGPQSPSLASTPYSIDISMYQRLIPPATSKEIRDLFKAGAPSALADRLIELVPSGRLVFVYPTSAGARTFERDYLDKALAPISRSIVFGKGLPAEACSALARSSAAAALPDFETMRSQMVELLTDMAAAEGPRSRSKWSILSSGTQGITLPHTVWKQWWTMQETPRIRAVMDYYFRQVSRQRAFYRDERFTANELARQLTQDLCQRADDGDTPPPIEVAVFVIERNA